ncbi:putative C2H2 finger domain protein [Aspergillus mulundensis]|uniref:C2H2-type domain-containing protein n=1 Tax=Aspergillus mulundensis TaxID=1810919 RepID=A0A3D8S693_9EURO|nr:hypothetical protein DSM5745_05333 [Aspergillus mulundensis]RDW81776.1 hypothetical protein DSM5745_05333 [Aspergillus mulundensis]
MSAAPHQFVQSDSTDRNFDPELSNLYLSTAIDPEEAEFQSSALRLTPVDDRGGAWNSSASPLERSVNNASTPDNREGYGTSYSEFLSPVEDWTSDISGHTSPADLTIPGVWPTNNTQTSLPNQFDPRPPSPHTTMDPSQLLTPNLTNHPSPASDAMGAGSHRVPRSHQPPIPRLITTPINNTLGPRPIPESVTTISPIVKVESYSRGDSPVRDSFSTNRRPSQSSVHLSPGGASNASDEDATMEYDNHSISRSANGAWVPNALTGQSGLAPNAREDVYVLSPSEVDSQRKLAERNADIYTWSEAVSEAHSEAGDDYLPSQRGRSDRRGTRRRAKSTGDPSLQQDYFNLKFHPSRLEVPGPGLLLQETSDFSEDGTDSSAPVSVKEEMWAREASEITSPGAQATETGESQPHQFLGSPPWRDVELDLAPRTTPIQPVSSTQAMVEYQRRAREYDALSRVATWGTRDLDANSIKSFQMMNLNGNGKEKKHERRSSLLKYFPQKKGGLLKRQRQKTDISTIEPVLEGQAQDTESKPAPQRKDSFPHRLSLGLSQKSSSSYSIGGAVMATTRQMAAIGGKDSLSVVSPNSTSKPWNTLKVRGRSRSEVPRAPGLLELMTSHGGPPVPNINYTTESTANTGANPAGPDHDAEEEDDDGSDEKGLVMEFPIPPNLPVPTLEGFRTQILQLNPRLEPALIDRFAHEQVRRYKRLIEIKQTHARDVNRGKCKAGKFCFALGGNAKLLPPRASAQDADSHTQFQIPGRDETEESPKGLGETTIATAQFPPGVPLPPPQVKLLPAEFECMVCFHIKKFQKPSDWTKHVYEDVQPFTCTFPDCTDPKSFKRKADWVRHESERHRQLEWWECLFTDCRHKCYRKDNFVQHLVREHKLPEPKVKKSKNKELSKRAAIEAITPELQEEINREQEINKLWELVESCRFDTAKSPREEPCRFCGNVCTNWKKLTVHLAKHMEQLAIPILGLVDERDFPHDIDTFSNSNTDICSGQMSVSQESKEFAPKLNTGRMAKGLGPSINFTQGQYTSSHAGASEPLAMPFNTDEAYIPATSMPIDGTAPSQLNNFEGISQYATHGGMPEQTALAEEQPRLIAMHQHQNST